MDETKEKILVAARRIISEKGYDQASIKRIAAQAGVAPGLLHYYFKNKEDLLIQVMNSFYEGGIGPSALERVGVTTPEQLASVISTFLRDVLRESPDYFRLTYGIVNIIRQSDGVRRAMEEIWGTYRRESETIIARLKTNGVITSDRSPEVILTLIIGVMHGVGIQAIGESGLKLTESDELWDAVEKNVLSILTNP